MNGLRIKQGRIIDPSQDRDEIADLWVQDGKIVADDQLSGSATVSSFGGTLGSAP